MHNDFVLLGPPADPAGIEQADDAPDALTKIAGREARFASRGDDSGTHAKELSLWEAAGVEPEGGWYVETGQGMGETLTIAGQSRPTPCRTAAPSSPPRTWTSSCCTRAARRS